MYVLRVYIYIYVCICIYMQYIYITCIYREYNESNGHMYLHNLHVYIVIYWEIHISRVRKGVQHLVGLWRCIGSDFSCISYLQAHFRIISEWVLYSVLHSPERSFHTKVAETGWRFPADFPSTPLNPSVPNFTKFMIFAGLPDDQETSKPLLVRAVKACCRHSADCTVSGWPLDFMNLEQDPPFSPAVVSWVSQRISWLHVHPAVVSKVVVFVFARGMVHHSPELVDTRTSKRFQKWHVSIMKAFPSSPNQSVKEPQNRMASGDPQGFSWFINYSIHLP